MDGDRVLGILPFLIVTFGSHLHAQRHKQGQGSNARTSAVSYSPTQDEGYRGNGLDECASAQCIPDWTPGQPSGDDCCVATPHKSRLFGALGNRWRYESLDRGTFSLHKAISFNSDDRKHEPPPPTSLHNSVVKLVLRSQSALDDWAGLPGSDYPVPGKE